MMEQERKSAPVMVLYRNRKIHDVTPFLDKHPGGADAIRRYSNWDVTDVMMHDRHNHSRAAYSLLHEYAALENNEEIDDDPLLKEKETLERMVDWNRGLVWQVGSLGPRYKDWLELPVDRRLLLFDWPPLERLTSTPWYLVPLVWLPLVFLFIFLGVTTSHANHQIPTVVWVTCHFVCGLLSWTLMEYFLHRFLFHMRVPTDSSLMITLHFLLHGLHHKNPFDPGRLVFPPAGALILIVPIYTIVVSLASSGPGNLLCSGALMGYIAYDLTHYYLHHGHPKKGSYLHNLKRHHNFHHFIFHDRGYGVSSVIWDNYFGTDIKLNNMKKIKT